MTVLIFIILLISAGCGSKNESKRPLIAIIPMGTTHEYWKAIHAGAVKAATEIDVDILWKGPLKEDDVDEQIQIMETQIAAGVDAIVLAPLDKHALVRPAIEAKRRGIPTIIVDSALAGDQHCSFVSTDNYRGGALGAEHLAKLMNGTGKLILVRVQESSASSTNREEGFLATIKEKYPGMTILSDNQYGGITTESAYMTCENLLNRFPDVEAIFTPNESVTFGCLRALQDRGLAGKVVFVGFDTSAKAIDALAKREMHGLVVQDPFRMGYEGIKIAAAHLRGEEYVKRLDTGAAVATPDNMEDEDIRELLKPDLSKYLD